MMIRTFPPPGNTGPRPATTTTLPPEDSTDVSDETLAGVLLAVLRFAPRTWRELRAMGLPRGAALRAVRLLTAAGQRVRVGPVLVALEDTAHA